MRTAVLVTFVAFLLVVSIAAPAAGAPAAPTGSVDYGASDAGVVAAETHFSQDDEPTTDADWREHEVDDTLDVNESDGLNESELALVVERAMVRVEHLREVEFDEQPPVTVLTREEFMDEYGGLTGEVDADQRTFDNQKLKALFFVGEDEDSVSVRADNQNVSVAGFYSSMTNEIVLVSNDEHPTVNEPILAHELLHAWQDQRHDLTRFTDPTRDGSNAINGLIEGDAVYVEYLYEQHCLDEWECVGVDDGDGDVGDQPPPPANWGLLLLQFQPYSDGPAFVAGVYEQGGWDAVDALYDRPPVTTRQVIEPDLYPEWEPRAIDVEDTSDEGWERLDPDGQPDHQRLGMAAITAMFVAPLYESGGTTALVPRDEWFNWDPDEPDDLQALDPLNYDTSFASGWDGDYFSVYERDDGETAYVWKIAWESTDDAATFVDGYHQLLEYRGADAIDERTFRIDDGGFAGGYHVATDDDVVTIVHAPSIDDLSSVHASVGADGVGDDESTPGEPSNGAADSNGDDGVDDDGDGDDDADDLSPAITEQPGFSVGISLLAVFIATLFVLAHRRQR